MDFIEIIPGIYRLKVPFENIYTSVFLVKNGDAVAVIDSASSKEDAENYIIPALDRAGVSLTGISVLLNSHFHGDHFGGHDCIVSHASELTVGVREETLEIVRARHPSWKCRGIKDGELVIGCLRYLSLPGHDGNSVGFLDERTNTLISCDSLQLYGVGRYGCGLQSPAVYRKTLDIVSNLCVSNIIASHEYVPLGSIAQGKDAVREYISVCVSYDIAVAKFINEKYKAGIHSASELAKLFADRFPEYSGAGPFLPKYTIEKYIGEMPL